MFSAPQHTPTWTAMDGLFLPMTSTIKVLSWLLAVSRILSTALIADWTAVSKPIVYSVPEISLSIVDGTPITGKLYSSLKIFAPLKEPFPPRTIKASIFLDFKFSKAFFRPSLLLNSWLLEV